MSFDRVFPAPHIPSTHWTNDPQGFGLRDDDGESMAEYFTPLIIDGQDCGGDPVRRIPIENPADESIVGYLARASQGDMDRAIAAAQRGQAAWSAVNPHDRGKLLRKAAAALRAGAGETARRITLEHGKPLAEALGEINLCAETIDWFAEEARRSYGRVIPWRVSGVVPMVIREPVGIVAAFTPWNLPMLQVARKIAAGLAAGCAFIVKGPEEAPAGPVALVRAFLDAGLPSGALNLLFGDPAEISSYLVPHPAIAKISFTGSVPVGKQLAAMAGLHMKRATMELGGHAPAIICADADPVAAARALLPGKIRNAGQTCISPTRFIVHRSHYTRFIETFTPLLSATNVGNGMDEGVQMGPLVHARRLAAVDALVHDAVGKGARLMCGGQRLGNVGHFYAPTLLADVTPEMAVMNEEPFGPVAAVMPFDDLDEALVEANRLAVGLGAYAFAESAGTINRMSASIRAGMVRFNQLGAGGPELPFGGVGDSGYGWECGIEGLDAYLSSKLVSIGGV
jgi:succinate-semialdehyde dehydrogenase/glutarate-semialdehyde dehydrogenase